MVCNTQKISSVSTVDEANEPNQFFNRFVWHNFSRKHRQNHDVLKRVSAEDNGFRRFHTSGDEVRRAFQHVTPDKTAGPGTICLREKYEYWWSCFRCLTKDILTFREKKERKNKQTGSSIRLMFFDFSSAFNTRRPHLLVQKLLAWNCRDLFFHRFVITLDFNL